MNLSAPCLLFSLLLLLVTSCQRPFLVDDDSSPSSNADWQLVEFQSEQPILGLHTTPFEWYVITENQFARFDHENLLLDKRPLLRNNGVNGIPIMSDNTFFRLTINDDASQQAEFHLSRNPSEVYKINVDSIIGSDDSFHEVDIFARNLGAFSDDGTLFMLPTIVLPDRHYEFLIFEIRHNTAHSSFTSIEIVERVEIEELSAEVAKLNNIRFLNGNFYVTSKEGAWRITLTGELEKIFHQWMLDCFVWDGNLYITGTNSFDMHRSNDNGHTWVRLNQQSDLQYVETVGEYIFTHLVLGHQYKVCTDSNLSITNDFSYPSPIPTPTASSFYGVGFLNGKYYFSIDREVFYTESIVVE